MEPTKEKSMEQAAILTEIFDIVKRIDIDYMKAFIQYSLEEHNKRDAMAVMNPRPFIHSQQQQNNSAAIHKGQLVIQLAEAIKEHEEAESNLRDALIQEKKIAGLFGM